MEGRNSMYKMKLRLLSLLMAFLSLSAFSLSADEAEREYLHLMERWIRGEENDTLILNGFSNLENKLDNLVPSNNRFYWKSRVLLITGQIHFYEGREDDSLETLEKSREWAFRSIESGGGSDSWRILSEAGSYIMIQKGVGYIIANSADIQEQAERSLELDGANARAGLIVAQGLVNAPALFGGNKKKGIADLEALNRRSGLSMEDRFFLSLALAENYENVRKKEEARSIYTRLAGQYPGNSIVREKLSDLGG
jgi:hypothetical protein